MHVPGGILPYGPEMDRVNYELLCYYQNSLEYSHRGLYTLLSVAKTVLYAFLQYLLIKINI